MTWKEREGKENGLDWCEGNRGWLGEQLESQEVAHQGYLNHRSSRICYLVVIIGSSLLDAVQWWSRTSFVKSSMSELCTVRIIFTDPRHTISESTIPVFSRLHYPPYFLHLALLLLSDTDFGFLSLNLNTIFVFYLGDHAVQISLEQFMP